LGTDDLERLQYTGEERRFKDGEIIFKEGDPGLGLYLVLSGKVRITAVLGDSGSKPLAIVEPGDFFGEMAVIDGEPRSANAIADGETNLLFLPSEEVMKFLDHSPRAAVHLVKEFSRRMRDFNRRYVQEMLQADRMSMVGRFASSIVHDFKNPLGVIGMSAELGTMEGVDQKMRDTSRARILKQVTRLSSMISELLEFTRGTSTTELLRRNFAEFILPLIQDIRAESEPNKVAVELESQPPSLDVAINEKRLPNLFFNLAHNAVDAMKPHGGKIIFRFRADGEKLHIEIEDSGKGIPPEIASRLFEPFATFGKAGGTGLGLSICKRIVQDHGGQITARNEPGRGAIFSITLPLAPKLGG